MNIFNQIQDWELKLVEPEFRKDPDRPDPLLSDFRFTELAPDCIPVKFASEVSGVRAHRWSIWSKQGGHCEMLHHQSTVVPSAT